MRRNVFLLTAFALGGLLAVYALYIFAPTTFSALDSMLASSVRPYQTEHTTEIFLVVTALGSLTAIVGGAIIFVLVERVPTVTALRLLVSLLLTMVLVYGSKNVFTRVRPEGLEWLTTLHTYSFPSGHTSLATVLYSFIALWAWQKFPQKKTRVLVCAFSLALVVLIGISRIVLSYHYGSDVLAGFFLGLLSVSIVWIPRYSLTESKYYSSR